MMLLVVILLFILIGVISSNVFREKVGDFYSFLFIILEWAGFLVIGYWAFCALSRASGYWALLSLASFFVFISVQKAAVFNNQQLGVAVEKSGLCRGEILSLIIGWV